MARHNKASNKSEWTGFLKFISFSFDFVATPSVGAAGRLLYREVAKSGKGMS